MHILGRVAMLLTQPAYRNAGLCLDGQQVNHSSNSSNNSGLCQQIDHMPLDMLA
jgi:hypothetical protein